MQSETLHKLLSSLSNLAESMGSSAVARDVDSFKELFPANEKTPVSKIVAGLQRGKPNSSSGSMSPAVSRLYEFLKHIEVVFAVAKTKSATDDMALVSDLLVGCAHVTISDLVSDCNTWRQKPKTSRRRQSSTSSQLRTEVIGVYVTELQNHQGDNANFDRLVSKLKSDSRVRVAEMRQIASLYLGYRIAKDKRKTLQAIVDHQAFNARQVARSQNQR